MLGAVDCETNGRGRGCERDQAQADLALGRGVPLCSEGIEGLVKGAGDLVAPQFARADCGLFAGDVDL